MAQEHLVALDSVGGVRFEDPYRWLEEDSAEALEWQRQQDAAAAERLHAWPGYARLVRAIEPYIAAQLVFAPRPADGRWFRLGLVEGRLAIDVDGRLLVDPGERTLDWFFPSPDGRYVAYGLSEGGTEQSVLHLVETDSGRVLPERIPHTSFCRVAWLPDSSGFYYSGGTAPDPVNAHKHIWFHRPGETPPGEPEPVPSREEFVFPQISPDGRWVAAVPSEIEPRPDHLLDRERDGGWRPFLRALEGVVLGVFEGDSYVAMTTIGASRGRVVSIPLDGGADPSTWRELVPESDAVVRGVSVVGGKLVVASFVDAHSRITVHSLDGALEEEVPLPGDGLADVQGAFWGHTVFEPMIAAGEDEFAFVFSSHARSGAVHRYDVRGRRLERLTEPAVELVGATTRRLEARSTDGAPVRMWVVHRGDLDLSQPRPALLYGYGGWNIAFLPVFAGALGAIVDAGGILAFANLRGGGELGWDWWQQGRLENKQRTFDDLYAAAELLIAEGLTASDRLAVAGASNGGLLAAAAVTQRPDLWKAVVSLVPLTDMLRFKRDSYAAECTEEYGDPDDPAFAPVLRAYSPVHNVRDGTAYPATLVVCGGGDIRCPIWHGRKLVAALQHATTGDAPVHLRVWPGAAHMAGVLGTPEQTAEWLGFVMSQIGLEPA